MARYGSPGSQGSRTREIALAGGIGAAAILLLALVVAIVWSFGRSPSSVPTVGSTAPFTPTPRAISLARSTEAPTAVIAVAPTPAEIAPAATVAPLVLAANATVAPTRTEPVIDAPATTAFDALASGMWTATADTLANDGTDAVAAPWLALATAPSATLVIEAEIRVTDLLDSVCDQSFGLTVGTRSPAQTIGGGLLFPCGGGPSRARLTDVSVWENGYNADPVLAEKAFEPGDDWRVYRFELDAGRLLLSVDGVELLSIDSPAPIDPAVAESEAGIWTQGVGIQVRRLTVIPQAA